MNKKDIDNAICDIDEKYLCEFETEVNGKIKRRKMTRNFLISACCFVVVAAVGFGIAKNKMKVEESENCFDSEALTNTTTIENNQVVNEEIIEEKAEPEKTTKSNKSSSKKSEEKVESENSWFNIPYETPSQNSEEKGEDTSTLIKDYAIGPDGIGYYKIFKPGVDTFNPKDNMTLENRFCSFTFKNRSYYPAENGDITWNDCESNEIGNVKALHWEFLTPDEEVVGIEYVAGIKIYKLKGIEESDAVACLISFNGETKLYKYLATDIMYSNK